MGFECGAILITALLGMVLATKGLEFLSNGQWFWGIACFVAFGLLTFYIVKSS